MNAPPSLHGCIFRAVDNSPNGEVADETRFHYTQQGRCVSATYQGGLIEEGHLLGKIGEDGVLEIRYHHRNIDGQLRSGCCRTQIHQRPDGRIELHERWQWLCGDRSEGTSTLIELTAEEKATHASEPIQHQYPL